MRESYVLESGPRMNKTDSAKVTMFDSWNWERDKAAGIEALNKSRNSSFWDWDDGSCPFFWRWQPEVHKDLRDGTKLWVQGDLPSNIHFQQKMPKEKDLVEKMLEKITKVRERGYIGPNWVRSLTSFFPVLKGDDDIRLVYDLTASGLNDALWVPNFWMPAVHNVLDCATHSSWFGDVDAGEMFLNFPLDLSIRPYCGVDLSWMDDGEKVTWETWHRMTMGMKSSPWVTCRLIGWMLEFVVGDKKEEGNPFRWDSVILNLPGDPNYNPNMPRVYKWNEMLQSIACDIRVFCDDFRIIGPTLLDTIRATHRLETRMGYLGIQDATRKRRRVTQRPGEWTGSIVIPVEDVGLFVTVSKKKWKKARDILERLWGLMNSEDEVELLVKDLEREVGFLVHLSMAFPLMKPFLRGFYLTMNSWRGDRDSHGWKMPLRIYRMVMALARKARDPTNNGEEEFYESDKNAPARMKPCPLFKEHLEVLRKMISSEEPTLRLVRGCKLLQAMYAFGDASGKGFGTSWIRRGAIKFRYGIWGAERDGSSSNYRELRNLVDSLEVIGECGDLVGQEVFFFTDNTTAENIARKGSSTSPTLFKLVARLYTLGMKYQCDIRFVHVAGTRMIAQGTDGLSRGDLLEGVMQGHSILDYIPLNESAFTRHPPLLEWIISWAKGHFHAELECLEPGDWIWRGQDIEGLTSNVDGFTIPSYQSGSFLWEPAPGAALFAIEALRQARHKRQESFHVWIVSRLLSGEWRKNLLKSADLIVEIPAGNSCWPEEMHESLTLALFFPYLSRKPWELRRSKFMVEMEGVLRRMFKEREESGGRVLSELCDATRSMTGLSIRDLRLMLSCQGRFNLPHQQRS